MTVIASNKKTTYQPVIIPHRDLDGNGHRDLVVGSVTQAKETEGRDAVVTNEVAATVKFRAATAKGAIQARDRFVQQHAFREHSIRGDFDQNGTLDTHETTTLAKPDPRHPVRRLANGNWEAAAAFARVSETTYKGAGDAAPERGSPDVRPEIRDAYARGIFTELPAGVKPEEGYKGPRVLEHQREVARDLERLGVSPENVTGLLKTSRSADGLDEFFGPKTRAATDLRDGLERLYRRNWEVDYDRLNDDLEGGNVGRLDLSDYAKPTERRTRRTYTLGEPDLGSGTENRRDSVPARYTEADATRDAQTIRDALPWVYAAQSPDKVANILANRTPRQIDRLRETFLKTQGRDLGEFISSRTDNDGSNTHALLSMLNTTDRTSSRRIDMGQVKKDVEAFHRAVDGRWFDDWQGISDLAAKRSGAHLRAVEQQYFETYGERLRERLRSDYGSWFGEPGNWLNGSSYLDSLFAQFDR